MRIPIPETKGCAVEGYDGRSLGTYASYDQYLDLRPCIGFYAVSPDGTSLPVQLKGMAAVELGEALVRNGRIVSELEAAYDARLAEDSDG